MDHLQQLSLLKNQWQRPNSEKTSTGLRQYRHTLLWTGHVRQTRLAGSTITTSNKTLFPQMIPQIISTAAAASSTSKKQKTKQCLSSVLCSFGADLFWGRRSSEGVRRSVETRAFTAKGEAVRDRQVCTEEQRQISLTSAASAAAVNWQLLGRC